MDPARWHQVCMLFERARNATLEERGAVLEDAGDLRDDLEELLRHHEEDAGLLSGRTDVLPAGTTVGTYVVESLLGTGGMGTVYRARSGDGATVALKLLHPHLIGEGEIRRRFRREADLGMHIRHPNVVRTLALVEDRALVLELVQGSTLADLANEQEKVSEELCRHLGREIAAGLAAIHREGVVHRDLKPENVLLTPENEVKLTDLGIALAHHASMRLSMTGQFLGTMLYSSPEQLGEEAAEVDGRSDLYSLGILLYELAAGRHPIPRTDLPGILRAHLDQVPRRLGEVNPQVSPFFEEVVHVLLAKDPADRFPDASTLRMVLAEGEAGAWWATQAEVVRARTKRPLRRVRVPRETDVVGREPQLERLTQAFEEAAGGRARLVLLEGEAGIGKTRLVDELVVRLQRDDREFAFLYGSYPPGGAATAAGALRAALLDALGGEAPGFERRLRRLLPDTPNLVPAVAAQLRGDVPPADAPALTQDQRREAYVRITEGLAAERPLLFVIDDLHFAPSEGRELFAALASVAEDAPVLLVGTTRPGLPADWRAQLERLPHYERIAVDRLGPKELTHLLVDALGSRHLAGRLAFPIAEKSDGNPFFVFELVRELKRGGHLRQEADGTWTTTGRIRELRMPDTVRQLIRARVDGLAEADREILDVAACVGSTFDPALVGEVLGLEPLPLLRALGRLERHHGLVRAAGSRFVFDHHQVQEQLYEALSEPLRRGYHAALGRTMAGEGELAGEIAWRVCEHLVRGGDGRSALRYRQATFDHLAQRFLHDAALDLSQRFLDLPDALAGRDRMAVLLARVEHLELLGDFPEAEAQIPEIRRLAEADGDVETRMRAITVHAWMLHLLKRPRASRELYLELHELASSIDHRRAMASAIGNIASTYREEGDVDKAIELTREYLGMVEALGDERGLCSGTANLAFYFHSRDRFEEARTYGERHIEIAERIGDLVSLCGGLSRMFTILAEMGEMERAFGYAERALELASTLDSRLREADIRGNYGNALRVLERHDAAREQLEEALHLVRQGPETGEGLYTQANLGKSLLRTGEVERATVHLEEACARAARRGDARARAYALHAVAEVRDEPGAREAAYRASLELLPEPSAWRLQGVVDLALLLQEEGREEEARAGFDEVEALCETLGDRRVLAVALAYLGRTEEARRLYQDEGETWGPQLQVAALHAMWRGGGEAWAREEGRRVVLAYLEQVPEAHRAEVREHAPFFADLLRSQDRFRTFP